MSPEQKIHISLKKELNPSCLGIGFLYMYKYMYIYTRNTNEAVWMLFENTRVLIKGIHTSMYIWYNVLVSNTV